MPEPELQNYYKAVGFLLILFLISYLVNDRQQSEVQSELKQFLSIDLVDSMSNFFQELEAMAEQEKQLFEFDSAAAERIHQFADRLESTTLPSLSQALRKLNEFNYNSEEVILLREIFVRAWKTYGRALVLQVRDIRSNQAQGSSYQDKKSNDYLTDFSDQVDNFKQEAERLKRKYNL